MMFKTLMLIFIIVAITPETYHKNYYDNGAIKSEGWLKNQKKTNYWFFYYSQGVLESKGHYKNGEKVNYWYYYNRDGNKIEEGHFEKGLKHGWWKKYKHDTLIKTEYENGIEQGLAIYEIDGIPIKAEYYKKGAKTNEWLNLRDFRKEYPKVNE